MKWLKYFFLSVFLFLLSCKPAEDLDPSSRARGVARDSVRESRDYGDPRRRTAELRRLKGSRLVIRAELDNRYDGAFYEDFDGEKCKEKKSCMAACDTLVKYSDRSRCYNSPQALVRRLEEGFFALLNISTVDSVDVSPNLLAGILDMDTGVVLELVEDHMSEGDLKSFLAWVAVNKDISRVFLLEDRRSKIIKEAFERLGGFQTGARKDIQTGLNTGLIHNDDSFFYLASVESNPYGFEIAHDILKSACSHDKNCKMNVLCAREVQSRSRSRIFGYNREIKCRTSAEQSRRYRRGGICYIHGASAWSYLNELIGDRDIRDSDFTPSTNQITVDKCNDYCGDKDSSKCQKIL